MSRKPLPEQFRRNTAVALIICFLVLLWLPTVDYFFHLDHAPMTNENRAMAKFPAFTPTREGLHDFPAGLEAFFRDHFGFRKRLIRWERKWKRDLFKEEASAIVLTGQHGWLYFSGDQMMEHFQGLKPFTAEELKHWQNLLEKRRDWLAQRGCKYLFVITADKQSIYPEYLPAWLCGLAGSNRMDQFYAHMKAHSTVEVLDVRPAVRAAKKDAVTYLKYDTHWTAFGGHAGYQALIQALSRQLPGLGAPKPYSAFEEKPLAIPGGDLTRLLSQASPPPEPFAFEITAKPPLTPIEIEEPAELLPKQWRPRTHPRVTQYAGATGKAIVFRDSFAGNWYKLLGYHFKDVFYIWQYEWAPGFIEKEKPDVVIDEILERFFNNTDPRTLMEKDALP